MGQGEQGEVEMIERVRQKWENGSIEDAGDDER